MLSLSLVSEAKLRAKSPTGALVLKAMVDLRVGQSFWEFFFNIILKQIAVMHTPLELLGFAFCNSKINHIRDSIFIRLPSSHKATQDKMADSSNFFY